MSTQPSEKQPVILSTSPSAFAEGPAAPLWYLAYGSNLSSSTFRGRRGIRPLDQKNVRVDGLELTFDLPGIPYVEPRFANCRLAKDGSDATAQKNPYRDASPAARREESSLDGPWTGVGALIGVAYLVTPEDFARVLATEGGGSSYQMVAVDGIVLGTDEPGGRTGRPTGEHIKAFTLLAPEEFARPTSGQPSLRYLTLLRDGAREHSLPAVYITYLDQLQHYEATSARQKLGRALFVATWAPAMAAAMLLGWVSYDKDGKQPEWVSKFRKAVFASMWNSYTRVAKRLFGDGEVGKTAGGQVRLGMAVDLKEGLSMGTKKDYTLVSFLEDNTVLKDV